MGSCLGRALASDRRKERHRNQESRGELLPGRRAVPGDAGWQGACDRRAQGLAHRRGRRAGALGRPWPAPRFASVLGRLLAQTGAPRPSARSDPAPFSFPTVPVDGAAEGHQGHTLTRHGLGPGLRPEGGDTAGDPVERPSAARSPHADSSVWIVRCRPGQTARDLASRVPSARLGKQPAAALQTGAGARGARDRT